MAARNPFTARAVKSRRGGPVKPPLSRDAIVRAALDLLQREGLEGMSLRKVAAALDTGAASLYAYVDDLRALQALVLDRALAGVDTAPRGRSAWRDRLAAVLRSHFHVLVKNPGLAQLAMKAIPAGPNALRVLETLLALLEEAGVDGPTAAWAVDLMLLYVTGGAVEQSLRRDDPDPLGLLAQQIGAVTASEHPRIHAARGELVSGDGDARFEWALEVLLAGILDTPRAVRRPTRAP